MRRCVASGVAGLVAGALSVLPGGPAVADADPDPGTLIAPMPVLPVALAQAGEVRQWLASDDGSSESNERLGEVPGSLTGVAVTQIAMADSVGFAVTADGRLVSWGGGDERLQEFPAEVAAAEVAQVATATSKYSGVVTRQGEVIVWGAKRLFADPTEVPAEAKSGVKQLVLTLNSAIALKNDGTVVVWGTPDADLLEPPEGLRATAITASNGGTEAYALTEDGNVVAWGDEDAVDAIPEAAREPGNVTAIASDGERQLALLADGSLLRWRESSHLLPDVPPAVLEQDLVAIRSDSGWFTAMDDSGNVHHWKGFYWSGFYDYVPAEEVGPVVDLTSSFFGAWGVIVTKMLRADLPQVAGSPKVGAVLTGTPGTFSAEPEAVSSRWLANGVPIPGATGTTLKLTAGMAGKQITYDSTATKTGEDTISSTSLPVTVKQTGPVRSKTKVKKVKVTKKAAKVVVTGKVTASKSPAGKAKVTIKKGKKKIVTKTVKVNAKGAVKLTVKKFAKLVAKKLKAKGKKAKTAYKGKYTVTIAYKGTKQIKASKATKKFRIKR